MADPQVELSAPQQEGARSEEAEQLRDLVKAGEDRILERLYIYAKRQEYTKYSSTLKEAWRMSIEGLTESLCESLDRFGGVRELHPDEDFSQDPVAAFGILEAKLHRERGVPLDMFLGLTKYYRQAYTDLVDESDLEPSSRRRYRLMLERFFDRVELGFTKEWLTLSESAITEELQRKNREMTNEKNRYLTIFESISSPVLLLDEENQLRNINHAAAETFVGEEIPGSFYYGTKWMRKFPWLAKVLKENSVGDQEPTRFEMTTMTTDGQRHFEGTLAPMLDVSDKFSGTVVILNDVTERDRALRAVEKAREDLEERVLERTRDLEEAQEQLVHSQKMEAIGTLAGGVAHDLNNLLQIVMGSSQLIEMWGPEDERFGPTLAEIGHAVERSAGLVRQLLLFSRKQPMAFQTVHLNQTVRDLSKMLQRIIGENIRIEPHLAQSLHLTHADPGSIEQVLMNLVVNARDAMPKGGAVVIRTENVSFEEGDTQFPGTRPGDFVRLDVEDSGTGMDSDTVERIFEPFFTTKALGEGTGLGLSVVYGIVEKHEGWINVYSERGVGTVFRVYLPVLTGEDSADAVEPVPLEELRGDGESVLVVEDEKGVRNFTTGVLTNHGYAVTETATAERALQLIEGDRREFDVIVSDIILPGMAGPDMAEIALSLNPDQRILFVSGYTADNERWARMEKRGIPLLPKPFTLRQLLQTVRQILGER